MGSPKPTFGYGEVLKDRRFLSYCAFFTLTIMTYLMVMTLLPVYMKDQYGIRESYFGITMTINALMVVTIEFGLTKWVAAKYKLEHILAVGALMYVLTAVVILGSNVFAGFSDRHDSDDCRRNFDDAQLDDLCGEFGECRVTRSLYGGLWSDMAGRCGEWAIDGRLAER